MQPYGTPAPTPSCPDKRAQLTRRPSTLFRHYHNRYKELHRILQRVPASGAYWRLLAVAEAGEELVGLCYFGDQQSRDNIEAELNRMNTPTNSDTRPRRSSSSSFSKTKH